METVHTFATNLPILSAPSSGPRSRHMGGFVEPPAFPPSRPMIKLNTPPHITRSDSPPRLSSSRVSPAPPPPPPRSPLRSGTTNAASLLSLADLYTKRDIVQTMRPRRDADEDSGTVSDSTSLASVLSKLHLNTPHPPPTQSIDLSSMSLSKSNSEKPLPQLPMESHPSSPIVTAKHSADTSDTWTLSSNSSDLMVTNGADSQETSSLLTLPNNLSGISMREHALNELLSSERAYASDLAFIGDVSIPMALGNSPPLLLSDSATPPSSNSSTRIRSTAPESSLVSQVLGAPMTKDDVRVIFGNIKELACFSNAFVDALEEALGDVLEDGVDEDYVGKLFLRIVPEMEPLYKQYITKHSSALAHLEALPQTPSLMHYMIQMQKLTPSVTHAWDLASLLIKPIQRLPNYCLLLATIAKQTPDDNRDKANLLKACETIENIARGISDSSRRLEVVKQVLTGEPQSNLPVFRKRKLNTGNSSLMRMRRSSNQDVDNTQEAMRVEAYEKRLYESDGFIRELAKRIVSWAQHLRLSLEHLRDWAVGFSKTIGISADQPSDAFDAFLELINVRLLPLCMDLDDVIAKEILPTLARLIDSSKAPKKLLGKIHTLKNKRDEFLGMNISPKHRTEASQTYVDIRTQLVDDLPTYLSLLDKGLVACIMQFARYQIYFWSHARDEWGTLWDCLLMEGERNVGCEESLRLWWQRYSKVEEKMRKLRMLSPTAEELQSTTRRNRPVRARSQLRSPDDSGRRKGRSNISPIAAPSPSPSTTHYLNVTPAVHSHTVPKDYTESLRSPLYYVRVIHPCNPPDGISYMNFPFIQLRLDEIYSVISELGHPSQFPTLPLKIDESESDTLLILKNIHVVGDVGLALASFFIRVDSTVSDSSQTDASPTARGLKGMLSIIGKSNACLTDLGRELLSLLTLCPLNKLTDLLITELPDSDRAVLVNALHELLKPKNEVKDRRRIDKLLTGIVKETGQLPTSMIIDNAKRKGANPLAGGGFADVWCGTKGDTDIAMKVLRVFGEGEFSGKTLQAFCSEALIWHRLDHRNIMRFYGICANDFAPRFALVSPWMKNGHLLDYLRQNPTIDRRAMMLGVACGVDYLHSLKPTVVHGDLRSPNVLIDDDGQPRISDFGLATFIDSNATTLNRTSLGGRGAVRWHAPELINPQHDDTTRCHGPTTNSDVYAFACVCLEIFTENVPFSNLAKDAMVIVEVGIRNVRPPRPPKPAEERGLSDEVWSLMQDCWKAKPSDRPNMSTVVSRVRDITGNPGVEDLSLE